MSFHKTYGNHIVSDITRLVQHFYKKGVLDGGVSGDEWSVRLITERENLTQNFQLLSEFSNKIITFEVYYSFVQTQFAQIKARAIQHWFMKVTGGYNIKHAICYLCDEYYRKGLSDGVKIGTEKAREYHARGCKSFAPIGSATGNEETFLIQINTEALRISVEREELKIKMEKLVEYIASVIRKRRDYYMNVSNKELK